MKKNVIIREFLIGSLCCVMYFFDVYTHKNYSAQTGMGYSYKKVIPHQVYEKKYDEKLITSVDWLGKEVVFVNASSKMMTLLFY